MSDHLFSEMRPTNVNSVIESELVTAFKELRIAVARTDEYEVDVRELPRIHEVVRHFEPQVARRWSKPTERPHDGPPRLLKLLDRAAGDQLLHVRTIPFPRRRASRRYQDLDIQPKRPDPSAPNRRIW